MLEQQEEAKIANSNEALADFPKPIVNMIEAGTLKQWRKHPNTLFVDGVDKARIVWKDGKLFTRYASSITCKKQRAIFRDTVKRLNFEVVA